MLRPFSFFRDYLIEVPKIILMPYNILAKRPLKIVATLFLIMLFPVTFGTGTELAAAGKRKYYRVRKGDTLSGIARRHRTSPRHLARLNRIHNPSRLRIGRRLRIYGKWKYRSKRYRRRRRARRRKSKPAREKHSWKTVGPVSILLPYNYRPRLPKKKTFYGRTFIVRLYSRGFRQGDAAYLEILHRRGRRFPRHIRAWFQDREIPLTKKPWGYRALFPLPPNASPGRKELTLTFTNPKPPGGQKIFSVYLRRSPFPTSKWNVYLGNYDKKRKKKKLSAQKLRKIRKKRRDRKNLIRNSTKVKKRVLALRTKDKFRSRLAHPRGLHKITSPFYIKRRIHQFYRKGGKKIFKRPYARRHSGVDLKGWYGKPIYAVADGVAVAARRMYYEGNYIIIDHGQGIFTGYMHLSGIRIREGQRIRAGQRIGKSGATGFVTGPHLHLNLLMRGVKTDALSLLSLPIRD